MTTVRFGAGRTTDDARRLMTWIKICGMTNLEDALVAVEARADAVGFVFYEKSPRYVTVEKAREIVDKLPAKLDKIGIFVNEEPNRLLETADEAGLTAIQLHGDEYRHPEQYSVGGKQFFCLPVVDILREMRSQSSSFYGI